MVSGKKKNKEMLVTEGKLKKSPQKELKKRLIYTIGARTHHRGGQSLSIGGRGLRRERIEADLRGTKLVGGRGRFDDRGKKVTGSQGGAARMTRKGGKKKKGRKRKKVSPIRKKRRFEGEGDFLWGDFGGRNKSHQC